MSTFYNLLLSIGRGNLSNHEIAFLAAHCTILDHGLQLSLLEKRLRKPIQRMDELANSKEPPAKNHEIQPSPTYPLVKLEDDSIITIILHPKWKLTDTSKEAYSVNYKSPLRSINEYQGPKSLNLRAIVIADKIVFHITDSEKPENLISFDLRLSDKHIEELADSLKTPIPSSTEHTKAEAVYMEFYTILHSHLSNSKETNVSTNVKSESTPTTEIPNNPITSNYILSESRPFNSRPMTENSPSEYIGPDDFIFRDMGLNRLQEPSEGVNIEPILPIDLDNPHNRPLRSRRGPLIGPLPRLGSQDMDDTLPRFRGPRTRPHIGPLPRLGFQDMDDDTLPRLGGPRNTFL